MPETTTKLKRLQLTDELRLFPPASEVPVPAGGWARAIREALGMGAGQLAARLKISRQSVQDLERAESERRITLDSLDRLAGAMGCRVVYALVPENGSLDDIRARRARAVAESMLNPTAHSMTLEAQGVTTRERDRHAELLVDELLRGSARKLWR